MAIQLYLEMSIIIFILITITCTCTRNFNRFKCKMGHPNLSSLKSIMIPLSMLTFCLTLSLYYLMTNKSRLFSADKSKSFHHHCLSPLPMYLMYLLIFIWVTWLYTLLTSKKSHNSYPFIKRIYIWMKNLPNKIVDKHQLYMYHPKCTPWISQG